MENDDERDMELAALALNPFGVVAPFFGAGGIVTAIIVGLFGVATTQWTSRKSLRRLHEFLEQLRSDVDKQLGQFEARLRDDEDAEDLAVRAARAAAASTSQSQARALADVLAKGVLGSRTDHAQSELLIAVLDGLTTAEIAGLKSLALHQPDTAEGASAVGVLSGGRTEDVPMAEAVMSRLIGRGLLQVDPPGFGGFSLTLLGREARRVLVEALP
jgi:hypothetical protein